MVGRFLRDHSASAFGQRTKIRQGNRPPDVMMSMKLSAITGALDPCLSRGTAIGLTLRCSSD